MRLTIKKAHIRGGRLNNNVIKSNKNIEKLTKQFNNLLRKKENAPKFVLRF